MRDDTIVDLSMVVLNDIFGQVNVSQLVVLNEFSMPRMDRSDVSREAV